jgi:hypothetical protein
MSQFGGDGWSLIYFHQFGKKKNGWLQLVAAKYSWCNIS